jgi:dTDP-L-rhamnose 4-epimerase
LLNFQPGTTFEEGIKKFTEWVNTQNIVTSNYHQSIEEMKQKGLFK